MGRVRLFPILSLDILLGFAFAGGVVKVKELDWLKDDLCTGARLPVPCPGRLTAPCPTFRLSALWPGLSRGSQLSPQSLSSQPL